MSFVGASLPLPEGGSELIMNFSPAHVYMNSHIRFGKVTNQKKRGPKAPCSCTTSP